MKVQKTILASLLLSAAMSANAAVIDISARDDFGTTWVDLTLDAGTYNVTQIADTFVAWNAWSRVSGCDSSGMNCSTGWINSYRIASSELGEIKVNTSKSGNTYYRYETPEIALANSQPFQFTISSQQVVSFYNADTPKSDNLGGLSLNVSAVPEPSTIGLMFGGLGLVGLMAYRSRKESTQA
jgi:hypothetical protein